MNSPTFQLIKVDLIPTIGIAITLTKSQNKNQVLISNLWKRFNVEIHRIGNKPPSGKNWVKFGIAYAENQEYFYLAAIPYLDDMQAPSNMIQKDIPRGRYACFTHTGNISGLKTTVDNIYKKILPQRNLTPEPHLKVGLIQFEKYDNRFHWNRPDSIIEIYVPMETTTPRVPP